MNPNPTVDVGLPLAEARTWLRDVAPHSPQFRGAGGKRTAQALTRVLERLEQVEGALKHEQAARIATEDQYLRAQTALRAWQGYAVALRLRRDALTRALRGVLEALPPLRVRWWHSRLRRAHDDRLWRAQAEARNMLAEPEPEPPQEPAA